MPIEDDRETKGALLKLVALPSAADRWVMLAVTVLMAAPLVIAIVMGKVESGALIGFVFFYFLCYYPATAVALRSAKLHGFLRYFFCITALPIFFTLLGASISWVFGYLPILSEGYSRARDAGGRSPGMPYAVLVAIGPVVVLWVWYRVLRLLDALFYAK